MPFLERNSLFDFMFMVVKMTNKFTKMIALFGPLVPAMCNRTSCAQVHKLPQSHCGDNREGTLFS